MISFCLIIKLIMIMIIMPGSGVAHLWEVDRGRRISEKKKKQASKQASKQANKQTNSRQTTIYIYRKHVLPVDLPGS